MTPSPLRRHPRAATVSDAVAARGAVQAWVVDFLNLGVGPLRTGIFNFADVALMVGVGLLVWPERRTERLAARR